jgi:hypothetical protein
LWLIHDGKSNSVCNDFFAFHSATTRDVIFVNNKVLLGMLFFSKLSFYKIDFMKFNLGTVAYRHPMSQKPANKQDYRLINLIHNSRSTSINEPTLIGHRKYLFHGWSKSMPTLGGTNPIKLLGASSTIMSYG